MFSCISFIQHYNWDKFSIQDEKEQKEEKKEEKKEVKKEAKVGD